MTLRPVRVLRFLLALLVLLIGFGALYLAFFG